MWQLEFMIWSCFKKFTLHHHLLGSRSRSVMRRTRRTKKDPFVWKMERIIGSTHIDIYTILVYQPGDMMIMCFAKFNARPVGFFLLLNGKFFFIKLGDKYLVFSLWKKVGTYFLVKNLSTWKESICIIFHFFHSLKNDSTLQLNTYHFKLTVHFQKDWFGLSLLQINSCFNISLSKIVVYFLLHQICISLFNSSSCFDNLIFFQSVCKKDL